ncbi:isoprenyl transferase [Paenibacillus sp. LC231]|uniref:isoprenyl transferase n=1 Tax=Paenibacillus TaxID=44249 RepID=UPI0008DE7695|nr:MULTISPECIES: isoprenyl transferase [Paenibacillus]MBU5346585.1 isoprenyl transferase [Paenibacillus lautus]MBX4147556.1 isoprenyl transferase [Paenibacillus lautus]MCT1398640.1 isoprenyl transferase [Paenibacillus sp. p3-SID867]OIB02662.1 isoprenyl transferase [Paenibacillus sp. LC231]RAR43370.1 isoprenyl transferase [Paenibacillus sp. MDMC362]
MIKRVRSWLNQEDSQQTHQLSPDNIPHHVAIIMDGNGRWAKRRGMPRIVGHQNGMKAVKRAAIAADDLGIKILTMYAFSTENWTRPKDEVDFLMKLPQEFLAIELEELIEKNVQVRMMGHPEDLPSHTVSAMEEAVAKTAGNDGLVLNFALNYGSRKEITESVKALGREVRDGILRPEDITEELIGQRLLTGELPDPDLLIRTSGELRLSNFMLWQLAYSELWFTDAYWPEFTKDHLVEAVADYQQRTRRYGGLS